jgi:hypothetical protein
VLITTCIQTGFAQSTVTIGSPEQIYPSSNPIADAVCATLKKDADNIYIFRSSWNTTFKYYGPLIDPQHNLVTNASMQTKDIITIPSALQSAMHINYNPIERLTNKPTYNLVNFYLKNVYDLGNGNLLGFLHLEYLDWVPNGDGTYSPNYTTDPSGAPTANHYRIGLCYSTNTGDLS